MSEEAINKGFMDPPSVFKSNNDNMEELLTPKNVSVRMKQMHMDDDNGQNINLFGNCNDFDKIIARHTNINSKLLKSADLEHEHEHKNYQENDDERRTKQQNYRTSRNKHNSNHWSIGTSFNCPNREFSNGKTSNSKHNSKHNNKHNNKHKNKHRHSNQHNSKHNDKYNSSNNGGSQHGYDAPMSQPRSYHSNNYSGMVVGHGKYLYERSESPVRSQSRQECNLNDLSQNILARSGKQLTSMNKKTGNDFMDTDGYDLGDRASACRSRVEQESEIVRISGRSDSFCTYSSNSTNTTNTSNISSTSILSPSGIRTNQSNNKLRRFITSFDHDCKDPTELPSPLQSSQSYQSSLSHSIYNQNHVASNWKKSTREDLEKEERKMDESNKGDNVPDSSHSIHAGQLIHQRPQHDADDEYAVQPAKRRKLEKDNHGIAPVTEHNDGTDDSLSTMSEAFVNSNGNTLAAMIEKIETPIRDATEKKRSNNMAMVNDDKENMTPQTPMATLKRIGNSPIMNNNSMNMDANNVSKRELFKEKLSAINIEAATPMTEKSENEMKKTDKIENMNPKSVSALSGISNKENETRQSELDMASTNKICESDKRSETSYNRNVICEETKAGDEIAVATMSKQEIEEQTQLARLQQAQQAQQAQQREEAQQLQEQLNQWETEQEKSRNENNNWGMDGSNEEMSHQVNIMTIHDEIKTNHENNDETNENVSNNNSSLFLTNNNNNINGFENEAHHPQTAPVIHRQNHHFSNAHSRYDDSNDLMHHHGHHGHEGHHGHQPHHPHSAIVGNMGNMQYSNNNNNFFNANYIKSEANMNSYMHHDSHNFAMSHEQQGYGFGANQMPRFISANEQSQSQHSAIEPSGMNHMNMAMNGHGQFTNGYDSMAYQQHSHQNTMGNNFMNVNEMNQIPQREAFNFLWWYPEKKFDELGDCVEFQ